VASLALAAGYLVSRRKSGHRATAAFGLAGALIGFAGGMAWSTRHITGDMARGAKKNIDATRNAHWLAKHPVDYA
jgi:Na+/H+ antiporter NhaC